MFECVCKLTLMGAPEDTLMAEGHPRAAGSNLKHEVFIDQSVYDPCRNIVMYDCPECEMDHLTTVRVGETEDLMYLCDCGYRELAVDRARRVAAAPT